MSVTERTSTKVMENYLQKFNQLKYRMFKCYKINHQEHTPRQITSFTKPSRNINFLSNLADRLPD